MASQRFQFSILTAFFVITAIAILCVLARWQGVFPYWTIIPGLFFVASCFVSRYRQSSDLAWGLFTIAWLIALIDVIDLHICSFRFLSGPPSESELQHGFILAYVSGLALPFFLSLPAISLAIKASRGIRSCGRKWIIIGSIVGLADVTVLTIWLILFIGYTLPWW